MTSAPTQNAPAVKAAPPPTEQQIANAESRDRQKLEIEAMVSAMVLHDSSFQGKLNTQIVWHFLQAPDTCFGWQPAGPMPLSIKLLCVAACLKLGFTPGMGHVIWMGNKPYVSAEGLRLKSNRDPAWVYTKAPRLRPMNQDEKELYGIEAGDLGAVIFATVQFKGQEMEMEGVGIIERGCNKPGSVGKKNRAMKVRTFAERDMLRRFYPCDVPVYDGENNDDTGPQMASANIPQIDAGVLVKAAAAQELAAARQAFDKEIIRLLAAGITKDEINAELGASQEVIGGGDDPIAIYNAAEVLQAMHQEPTPPPPAKEPKPAAAKAAPAPTPAPAGEAVEEVKRRPGRPKGSTTATAPQPAAVAPAAPIEKPEPDLKAMAAKHLADHGTPSPEAEAGYQAARGAQDVDPDQDPTEEEMDPSMALPPPMHSEGVRGDHASTASWNANDAAADAYRTKNAVKAYSLIQSCLKTPEAKADLELELALHSLYALKLKEGDQVEVARLFRLGKTGKLEEFTAFEKARERL